MELIEKTQLQNTEFIAIYELWNSVYPSQVTFNTTDELQQFLDHTINPRHICAFDVGVLIGWVMSFEREGNRWFVLLVSKKSQGLGVGSNLLKKLMTKEQELFGWIIMHNEYKTRSGQVYRSPKDFYMRNGFQMSFEEINKKGIITRSKAPVLVTK